MEDEEIVSLYWQRNEAAIAATAEKYGRYCFSIVNRFLQNTADAEECVNDTFHAAWNTIPPHRPESLAPFLGKIARRRALNLWRERSAEKLGGGEAALLLDELEEVIPSGDAIDARLNAEELAEVLNRFLDGLPVDQRRVFLRRYWYLDPVRDISARFGFGQSKVKMMLKRTRDMLAETLQREGFFDEK